MSEIATFFRHRDEDPGATYQVDSGPYRFFVYSRKAIQRSLLKQAVERKEPDAALGDLRSALKHGGLLVKATTEGSHVLLEVEWFGARETASTQFLVLSPGRPPRFEKGEQKLPANSHVIVPVDRDAEAVLEQFIDRLEWLSPDLETLVLNTIRRPSFDARLDQVEEKLFGETAHNTSNAGRFKRTLAKLKRSFTPAVFGITTGILVAALLGASAYAFWMLYSRVVEISPPIGKQDGKKPGATPDEPPINLPLPIENSTPVDETRWLMARLRQKQVSNTEFHLLYAMHFEQLYKDTLSNAEVKQLFEKRDKNQPFLWGLIKLQLLKLDPKPQSETGDLVFLAGAKELTASNKRFTEIGLAKSKQDKDGHRLLAFLTCRLGYKTPAVAPGFPKVGELKEVEVVPNGNCTDFQSFSDVENGLVGLIKFVEETK